VNTQSSAIDMYYIYPVVDGGLVLGTRMNIPMLLTGLCTFPHNAPCMNWAWRLQGRKGADNAVPVDALHL
jgi:hypothetical protein